MTKNTPKIIENVADRNRVATLPPSQQVKFISATRKHAEAGVARAAYLTAPLVATLDADEVGKGNTYKDRDALARACGWATRQSVAAYVRLAVALECGVSPTSTLWRGMVTGNAINGASFGAKSHKGCAVDATWTVADFQTALDAQRERKTRKARPNNGTNEPKDATTAGQNTGSREPGNDTPVAPVAPSSVDMLRQIIARIPAMSDTERDAVRDLIDRMHDTLDEVDEATV